MALLPLEPCPHCPATDPLQRLLESTQFYVDDSASTRFCADDDSASTRFCADDDSASTRLCVDGFSSDEDDEGEAAPIDVEEPKCEEICQKCRRLKIAHPPPYGPWCRCGVQVRGAGAGCRLEMRGGFCRRSLRRGRKGQEGRCEGC